jgi:glycosyltransferase involved in cell wall biosynthesis
MFVDATKEIADLDMLFYVPSGLDTSPSEVSAFERTLSRHWNCQLRLFLCPRFERGEAPSKWQLYGAGVLSFFRQSGPESTSGVKQVQAFEACLDRKPDMIFAHKLASMCPLLLATKPLPPIFFDLDDIEHIAFLRAIDQHGGWHSKLLQWARLPALWWGERRAIQLSYRTFVCSDVDQKYLANRWRLSGVLTVPNAVNIAKLQPVPTDPILLFLGTYWYQPNVQAAQFLIEKIWPHIYRGMPEARLIIAGRSPERIPGYNTGLPRVEFTGFVDNLDQLYQRARVVCCPVLAGGGTRVKIIEAAAHGKAIVATRVGAEGLDLRDGSELLLRDDPKAFAQACLQLLKDSRLCERLGSAAHSRALHRYARADTVQLIQSYLKNGTADFSGQRGHPHSIFVPFPQTETRPASPLERENDVSGGSRQDSKP